MPVITYLEAINQALHEEMARDARVFLLGEDIGAYGGAFRVTDGLIGTFGEARVIDTPISEIAIP
jgi:2-oxoisovalerate dehydrogenase E1 component subunit beta